MDNCIDGLHGYIFISLIIITFAPLIIHKRPILTMSLSPYVTTTVADSVATIEFYHPSHNSLPSHILASIVTEIESNDRNSDVEVVVLKSGGDRTFCAGASFDEMLAINDKESGQSFFMGFANVINACRKCSKLIIGRVQGKAIGGGVGLASAVDYCIASKYASVKLSELAVGIGPFVVGPAVERKTGLSAMSHLAINATEFMTAQWAKEKGLFNEVFDTVEQVDAYVKHLSQILVNQSKEAKAELKSVLWSGTENWDQLLRDRAEISGRLILTEDAKNAMAKFKTKA